MKTISCMKIDEDLLKSNGGEIKNYNSKDFIFRSGDKPLYYWQIVEGTIKLNHYNEDGKEFVHNILGENQSFGDACLFVEKTYPMNAYTLTPCTVIKLPKNKLFSILKENPEISFEMNSCLSHRVYHKMIMIQSIASASPVIRIRGLMDYLKSFQEDCSAFSFPVKLTRQQIADFTGLRVETVIRTLKKMEQENSLKFEKRVIFF